MRTKPTDNPATIDTMKRLPLLLLSLVSLPAFSSELRIDPARLHEQVQQRSEQAAQQGAAPSAPAEWLIDPAASAQGHTGMGQGHGEQGAGAQRGYGQGYEQRYGQAGDRAAEAYAASPAGISQGVSQGMSQGSGQGAAQGGMGGGGRGGGRH